MSHQAGYSNTVAVSGTALTSHHVQLLERLSDKVVLALDADRAGINAMKKAADVMLRRGLDVKVAELPMGKDPADLIQEDVTEFKKIVGKSVHVIEFILHVLRREITDNRSFKLKVREEVLPFILLLPNRIDQEHFVSKVAESINTSTDAVRYELDHLRREGSGGVILVEKKDSNKPTYSGSLLESTYVFILAVAEVQAELKNYLYGEIEKFEKFLDMPIVDPSTVAKTTFEISDAFAHKKELEIYEEIINQLNHLRREVAKMRLSLLRTEQEDIFENKDAVDILRQCEEMRKNDIYNVDLLINQKD
jgi:DNA primase